ncbi:hypothetical protein LCGC14_0801570 [marine sediment metagenome]|uniref:Uncharacterized protein n=1 Tax=marine sediment metagenome TaxID=412755 RepID=A0A0F9PU28_9ZZZZ
MSKSIKIPTKKEQILLEDKIKALREKYLGRFPELLEINSEQKSMDYKEDQNCRKCEYLKYGSTIEEVKNEISGVWKFCFANKENACYCCRVMGSGGLSRAMVEIPNPEKSLCTSYFLNTYISPYLVSILQKYRWKREIIEFKESELIRIEKEKQIALRKYDKEMNELDNTKISNENHRYSERNKSGKFGKEQPKSIEEEYYE